MYAGYNSSLSNNFLYFSNIASLLVFLALNSYYHHIWLIVWTSSCQYNSYVVFLYNNKSNDSSSFFKSMLGQMLLVSAKYTIHHNQDSVTFLPFLYNLTEKDWSININVYLLISFHLLINKISIPVSYWLYLDSHLNLGYLFEHLLLRHQRNDT